MNGQIPRRTWCPEMGHRVPSWLFQSLYAWREPAKEGQVGLGGASTGQVYVLGGNDRAT